MAAKTDAYEAVTARIIEALEAGVVPWHKPWKTNGIPPTSLATGKPYRGINVWTLAVTAHLRGYSSPYWTTFKQAVERGGNVRKGEKGTQVVLWKPIKKTVKDATGQDVEEKFLVLRYFTVFNADQCEDLADVPELPDELEAHDPIESAEAVSYGYLIRGGPKLQHGGDRAFYRPFMDTVQLPLLGQFDTPEGYYGTLFHELAHSTGHESRLARPSLIEPTPFGTPDYSKEELVAEMTAAFLCGEAGIPVNVEQSAAYIESWLRALKDDRKLLVQAAAAAQKAADLVLGIEYQNGEGNGGAEGRPSDRSADLVGARARAGR